MGKAARGKGTKDRTLFGLQVGTKEARKLKARQRATPGIWFGLGMFGLIGWSVAAPTLIGAVLGRWLDRHYPGNRSWTLMLLIAGLIIGCLNAWRWVAQEDKDIKEIQEEKDE